MWKTAASLPPSIRVLRVLINPYILLLNPDAVVLTGLESLCRAAISRIPQALAEGCSTPTGKSQVGFMVRQLPTATALVLEALLLNRAWPDNPVNRRYRLLGRDYSLSNFRWNSPPVPS